MTIAAFSGGLLVSYVAWGITLPETPRPGVAPADRPPAGASIDLVALREQITPPDGYRLGVRYGSLGPSLLEAGVVDYDAFAGIYEQAGMPLTEDQVDVLTRGSDAEIVITPENAHFLLNFFWAVGLANHNSILADGDMVRYGDGNIERFASTGGWTLGSKPVSDIFASLDLIQLTAEQQKRVEEVAAAVYRPCCDNPTSFPDCNHGMAMLGLLELMASQDAGTDAMFEAARYVNAYWFPQQALEVAVYLSATADLDFARVDPRMLTGAALSSGSGFSAVHESLGVTGLMPQAAGGSGNCSN
jgi:hypothetical protein